jgi:hypothetical protein
MGIAGLSMRRAAGLSSNRGKRERYGCKPRGRLRTTRAYGGNWIAIQKTFSPPTFDFQTAPANRARPSINDRLIDERPELIYQIHIAWHILGEIERNKLFFRIYDDIGCCRSTPAELPRPYPVPPPIAPKSGMEGGRLFDVISSTVFFPRSRAWPSLPEFNSIWANRK